MMVLVNLDGLRDYVESLDFPDSWKERLLDEPELILKYLDLNEVAGSKNPYLAFLRGLYDAFGKKTKNNQGFSFWQKLEGKYVPLNWLFRQPELQNKLKKEFKGALKRKIVKEFFDSINQRRRERQLKLKENLTRTERIKVASGFKTIQRSKARSYSKKELEWFKTRKKRTSIRQLVEEYNATFFDKPRTYYAIRDRLYRSRGKKKGR